jgi:hypothetical protein
MWICERYMRAHDFGSVACGGVGRVCAHDKTARQAQMHLHALGYYVRCEVGAKRGRMADEGCICGVVDACDPSWQPFRLQEIPSVGIWNCTKAEPANWLELEAQEMLILHSCRDDFGYIWI